MKRPEFEAGSQIRVQLPTGLVVGTIRQINGLVATLELPMPFPLASAAKILWPDGTTSTWGPGTALLQSRITVSLPGAAGEGQAAPRTELRRHPRYNVTLPVRISELSDSRPLVAGRTLNISAGGALLLCNGELAPRHRYDFALRIGGEEARLPGDILRQVGHQTYAAQWCENELGPRMMRMYFDHHRRETGRLPEPDGRGAGRSPGRLGP